MAKPLTIADKCLTLLVAVLVIMNIILACSIGLILPRHITKDGWIYIDDIDGASNKSLRISCTCSRIHTNKHEGNGTSGKQEDQGSNRKLECMMNGTGFKCFNPLSRNESHNISIETLPNRDEIKFEPQDYNEIEKSIRMTSLKEEMKGESTHDVLRNNTDLSKSAKDLLVNNSSISSITTSYPTDKPLISKRLYSSTLSGKEATSSNIVVVSRESVKIPETSIEEYPYERLAGTTRHTTDQTMNMMKIIPDELTEEYTQHAERMTAQRELMSRVVHRSYINSSESSKDLLVNNSEISSMTASYQTAKSPILMRLHQSTLAVKVNTFPDNVMVSKGPVGRENHSHMRVLQETLHHMTDEVNDLQTKISDKSTGATQHTEQITEFKENSMNKAVRIPASGRSSGIDNSSFTELPSNLEDNG